MRQEMIEDLDEGEDISSIKNLVEESVRFRYEELGCNFEVSMQGEAFGENRLILKLDGKLVQDLPRPKGHESSIKGIRKSTHDFFSDD